MAKRVTSIIKYLNSAADTETNGDLKSTLSTLSFVCKDPSYWKYLKPAVGYNDGVTLLVPCSEYFKSDSSDTDDADSVTLAKMRGLIVAADIRSLGNGTHTLPLVTKATTGKTRCVHISKEGEIVKILVGDGEQKLGTKVLAYGTETLDSPDEERHMRKFSIYFVPDMIDSTHIVIGTPTETKITEVYGGAHAVHGGSKYSDIDDLLFTRFVKDQVNSAGTFDRYISVCVHLLKDPDHGKQRRAYMDICPFITLHCLKIVQLVSHDDIEHAYLKNINPADLSTYKQLLAEAAAESVIGDREQVRLQLELNKLANMDDCIAKTYLQVFKNQTVANNHLFADEFRYLAYAEYSRIVKFCSANKGNAALISAKDKIKEFNSLTSLIDYYCNPAAVSIFSTKFEIRSVVYKQLYDFLHSGDFLYWPVAADRIPAASDFNDHKYAEKYAMLDGSGKLLD